MKWWNDCLTASTTDVLREILMLNSARLQVLDTVQTDCQSFGESSAPGNSLLWTVESPYYDYNFGDSGRKNVVET